MKAAYLATLTCASIFTAAYCAIAGEDRYYELEASLHQVPVMLFGDK